MNVLSLFDGISCGQIALERAEIQVDNYFASEIDKHAIKVTQHNYPDTIQLGDVTKWREWKLPRIDLLIGGSPCQGFSFAGKQLNFNDPRSKLFFEFVDVLNHYKPKHFLLENVVMKKKWKDIISLYLDVISIRINSILVTPQHRERLYWTNISFDMIERKFIYLKDIIDVNDRNHLSDEYITKKKNQKRYGNHFGTINTKISNCIVAMGKCDVMLLTDLRRYLTPLECERLQTISDYYTSCVSDSSRYKLIGNAWTVDIIAMIFRGIKHSGLVKPQRAHIDIDKIFK